MVLVISTNSLFVVVMFSIPVIALAICLCIYLFSRKYPDQMNKYVRYFQKITAKYMVAIIFALVAMKLIVRAVLNSK